MADLYWIESFQSADSRPRVGAFTVQEAVVVPVTDAPRMWWCEDTGAAWEFRPFLCGGPYHKSCGRVRLVKEDN